MAAASSSSKFKICLLGEGRVGKTSILLRYIRNEFSDKQTSTVQASYLEKRLNIGGQSYTLTIWDTAGQERYHALGPIYYRDSNAALLVYDVTDRESFNKVQNWVKELKKIVGEDISLFIAGNKIDRERDRQVPDADAQAYASKVGAQLTFTSAKTGKGVEDTFLGILKTLVQNQKSAAASGGGAAAAARGGRRGRDRVEIVSDAQTTPSGGGCC
eukprot:GABV01002085.1.p1 GENE.GABV01002085.1~~GABV01002085.1.p1  ORF type:complete len:248 (+),score=69.95 GABV01002085.1:101-745(+)